MIKSTFRFFDVAANLTDPTFEGIYHGKRKHPADRQQVIDRAQAVGCDKFLVAAGNLPNFVSAKAMYQPGMYFTIEAEIKSCPAKQLVAIGECGLDYDRLEHSSKEQQLAVFPLHFALAERYKLPLYLHNRNTGKDFFELMEAHRSSYSGGVLHSFTGTAEELKRALELGLYIGLNGCSLKTKENLEVVREVPLERLVLETDCPYCEIRKSHAGFEFVENRPDMKNPEKSTGETPVRGRNEPARIVEVLEAVSRVKAVER
ncbi:deoxyribonuclease TATDN1-like [Hippocampus zosterae]|uniref:deoxyribonuclease TATDN1-like n=1 Tax=Hippocampus zosterae TaxID=109293 RepID=UPI00223D8252|nr:deoxyribonuclease TATDN1-like [Hippocampus zosterae]